MQPSITEIHQLKGTGFIAWTLIYLFLCLGAANSEPLELYFVDQGHPASSDSNPGTESLPWKTLQHAANLLVAGDLLLVKTGVYREQVIPKNSGTAEHPIYYLVDQGSTVTIDGGNLALSPHSGLFQIQGLSHLRVSGFRVVRSGPHGTNVGISVVDSEDIRVENNFVSDTASSGIFVWSSYDVVVAENEVTRAMSAGASSENECITLGQTGLFVVRNNHVHHSPAPEITARRGEGIDVKDGSNQGTIHHNHVHHVPAVGIYVDAWDRHTYDISVYSNRVHHVDGDGLSVGSEQGGLLESIEFTNNISYQNRLTGITSHSCCTTEHPVDRLWITNNTFFNNGWDHVTNPWGGGIHLENDQAQSTLVRNNIVSDNLSFQLALEGTTDVQVDHNLTHGYRSYPGETYGSQAQVGNPDFFDANNGDFHLQLSSVAIDAGYGLNVPGFDFDGRTRPQGPFPDIGAFEADSAGCIPDSTTLCLNQNRFRVTVMWTDFASRSGEAQVVPFGSEDSGLLWFFAEDNWEMLIKVIDGCTYNEHFWVFASATTNVEYTLTVTDTQTGQVEHWHNPLGRSSPAITDTKAFGTCPG